MQSEIVSNQLRVFHEICVTLRILHKNDVTPRIFHTPHSGNPYTPHFLSNQLDVEARSLIT